jgi:hypothetical protein
MRATADRESKMRFIDLNLVTNIGKKNENENGNENGNGTGNGNLEVGIWRFES